MGHPGLSPFGYSSRVRKNYTTLIFDAFDTVVHINRAKLPSYVLGGETIHTTAPAVHSIYEQFYGKINLDAFFAAFSQSFAETEQIRRQDFKEVTSQERFRRMLRILGRNAENADARMLDSLTRAHMNQLQQALEVRPETLQFLNWASKRFRTAMISNFDYAPTLYEALERFGVRSSFERIVVSVEVGWRKPHPLIFERMFAEMAIQASEALFIGDQLYLDVLGSVQAGMDVVWLDAGRETWTAEFPRPTYRVESMHEIIKLLEIEQ
jgi:putative hydrolase of the HAD superfamily